MVSCIILTGYMGTGKSTVGKCLASRLRWSFVDLDALVSNAAGMSIPDIFTRHGEPYFRQLESEVLAKVCAGRNQVVSTGGGAVLADTNRSVMKRSGLVVNLTADVAEIVKRLADDDGRPLLRDNKSTEAIQAMLDIREPYYAEADLRIATDDKTVAEIVDEIVSAAESPLDAAGRTGA